MSYRPITDFWILARPKHKYYGGYPAGFLQRARDLIGANELESVLHVCSGKVKEYPYYGFGPVDKTLDIDGELNPDFNQCATEKWPEGPWKYVLADPPYTDEDAKNYRVKDAILPTGNIILRRAAEVVPVGGKIGILQYSIPRPNKNHWKFVASVAVTQGYENNVRVFSVFRRI